MFGWLRRRRRAALRETPFPDGWRAIVARNVPYAQLLSPADREELFGHVQVFLAEKHFEGCGGMEITDEVRITIAAQACVLLLHRRTDYYPRLSSILVYPTTYLAPGGERTADGFVTDGPQARLGESSARGAVVLVWDSVLAGAADTRDGHNVVFHEFAHQLDQESGSSNGAPPLPKRSMYLPWARVLGREYERLARDAERHHRTLIDQYGASNPAEFFAVATETFFERPRRLKAARPALYLQLKEFYQQDPADVVDR